jgi:hypothetical protein
MTYFTENDIQFIVINKRERNKWYITVYEQKYKIKSDRLYNKEYHDDIVYSEYKVKSKSIGFSSVFTGNFLGSLIGEFLNAILNAGAMNPDKK